MPFQRLRIRLCTYSEYKCTVRNTVCVHYKMICYISLFKTHGTGHNESADNCCDAQRGKNAQSSNNTVSQFIIKMAVNTFSK